METKADLNSVIEEMAASNLTKKAKKPKKSSKSAAKQDAFASIFANAEEEEPSPLEGTTPGFSEDQEMHIAALTENIPQGEGWYAKIYQKHPIPPEMRGKPPLVCDIKDLSLVTDIESYLFELGNRAGWESGIFEVQILKAGEAGIQRKRQVNLNFIPKDVQLYSTAQPSSNPINSNGGGGGGVDPYTQLNSMASFLKDLYANIPSSQPQSQTQQPDIATLLKTVMESYKTGAEVAKTAAPATSIDWAAIATIIAPALQPKPQPTMAEMLGAATPIITSLITAFVSKSPPTPFAQEMATMKEAGLLPEAASPKREGEMINQLIQLKSAGLIPENKPVDMMSVIEKGAGLLTLLTPLMEKLVGSGGNSSVGVEVIKTLGPQLGAMVKDITGTVNTAIQAKVAVQSTPQQSMNTNNPIEVVSEQNQNLERLEKEKELQLQQQQAEKALEMLKGAIKAGDKTFFPSLREMITDNFGEDSFNAIVSGTMPLSQITDKLKPLDLLFSMPQAIQFFDSFLEWAKTLRTMEVESVCACGEVYVFDSLEEFETEKVNSGVAGLKCEACEKELQPPQKNDKVEIDSNGEIKNNVTESPSIGIVQ